MIRHSSVFVIVLCVVVIAGCGKREYSGAQRYPLSGQVTYDGEPIDGSISLVSLSEGTQRPSGGVIENGKYSVPEAKGANAGTYRVEIRWIKRLGEGKIDETAGGEMVYQTVEGLPDKFHRDSELTVEVPSPDNTYNFDLKSD